MSIATIWAAPDAADTAAATIAAAEGVPLHLAHLQFYGYGTEGKRKFSSAAARLAELVNATPEVTIDIGQVMFGQTVTVSSDVMRQFSARGSAQPKKSVIHDGDGNGGGIVPYRYGKDFYGTMQWAVGLELFLLIDDPWRVFFTTDHPNGAPFTAYPALFELLMSREARTEMIAGLSTSAMALSTLAAIDREYTFEEIAIMTRAAPAKLLGLTDRGHLGAGAIADIAVYRKDKNIAKMLGQAALCLQERRSRRAGRRDHPLPLGQGAQAQSAAGQGDGAAAGGLSPAALRPVAGLVHISRIRRSRANSHSARLHAER